MKKVLAYTFAAVLLGVVTMLAPPVLLVSEIYAQAGRTLSPSTSEYMPKYPLTPDFNLQEAPIITEHAYGITPATYPLDFLSIAFMLTISIVVALGVMRYSKRKAAFRT